MSDNNLEKLVGKRIRDIRESKRCTQEELAHLASVSPAYWGRLERGLENPTLTTLIKVCLALDIEMVELFESIELLNFYNDLHSESNINESVESSSLEISISAINKLPQKKRTDLLRIIQILIGWALKTSKGGRNG